MKLKDLFKKVETANEVREMYEFNDNEFQYCIAIRDEYGIELGIFHNYKDMDLWLKDTYIDDIWGLIENIEIEVNKVQELKMLKPISFRYKIIVCKTKKGE